MRSLPFFIAFLVIGYFNNTFAQEDLIEVVDTSGLGEKIEGDERLLSMGMKDFDDAARGNKGMRVVFYNVENLFDVYDDTLTRDDEFTPRGQKGWSERRYNTKLNNIYKVLMAVGGWEPPAVVGFCELENRQVLEDLLENTPLRKFGYEIVHEDSPDRRGIDVGFIYRKSKFKYVSHENIRISPPFDPDLRTRDVLHISGEVLGGKDTLNIFVNHWPSRRGGQAASEPKRMYVAGVVRDRVDSLYRLNPNAKVIIMGDLNDEPEDKSVAEVLNAKESVHELEERGLLDYMFELGKNWQLGSHKYKEHWGIIDHMIASEPLVNETREGKLRAPPEGAKIFAARFLFEEDMQYLGLKPFRTYAGPRYLDGFSDHLPVYIDLWLEDGSPVGEALLSKTEDEEEE